MKGALRILILEDRASDAELMEWELKKAGISFTSLRVETRQSFEAALADFHPDLILSDYSLPGYNGRDALEFSTKNFPDIPVIMVTGTIGEEAAVELLKAGAKDYVLKDRMARLPSAVERALTEVEYVKARRESERALRESEERFRNTLEHAPIGIMAASLNGRFIEVNQAICDLLGYSREELLKLSFMDITHPDDKEKTRENVRKLLDGEIGGRLQMNRLEQALVQAKRHGRSLAVMFLDLDRFKEINDTLGHDVGDELLRIMAARLETCVRGGDTVSRQGGDEFVIVLPEIARQQDATLVAEKILKLLSDPVAIQGRGMKITTSIGIAVYPDDCADDATSLMKKADIAMYRAKEAGRNTFRFYSAEEASETGIVASG